MDDEFQRSSRLTLATTGLAGRHIVIRCPLLAMIRAGHARPWHFFQEDCRALEIKALGIIRQLQTLLRQRLRDGL